VKSKDDEISDLKSQMEAMKVESEGGARGQGRAGAGPQAGAGTVARSLTRPKAAG